MQDPTHGSPARAGIDREQLEDVDLRGGFPRTRGDRPPESPKAS